MIQNTEHRTQLSQATRRGRKTIPPTYPSPSRGEGKGEGESLDFKRHPELLPQCTLSIFSLLFVFCSLLSSAIASSWNLGAVLKEHLKNNYQWADVEISDLFLSSKVPEMLPEKIIVEKVPSNKTVFLLEFKDSARITATAKVKAYDWVVMSKRAFRKGYNLQKDDIYTAMMDVTKIPKDAVRFADKVIGSVLKRSVIANMPIEHNMISETPQVRKGQMVTLILESQGFNITAKGEIKENSYVGSYVKAVNLASKKTITGLLIDENTVRVEF